MMRAISHQNFSLEQLQFSEIMHSDWLKLVTYSAKSNQIALFHGRVITTFYYISNNLGYILWKDMSNMISVFLLLS